MATSPGMTSTGRLVPVLVQLAILCGVFDPPARGNLQEVEHIKAALHVRDGEIESLQQAIKSLEATRDSLADELVQTLQVRQAVGCAAGSADLTGSVLMMHQMRDADSNLHDEIEELRQAQRNAEVRLP